MKGSWAVVSPALTCLSLMFCWNSASAQWLPYGTPAVATNPVSDGAGNFIGAPFSGGPAKYDGSGAALWSVSVGPGAWRASAPDRSGGIVLAGGDGDIGANRVSTAGAVLWGAGATVCNAANAQDLVALATDAAGNSYMAWRDSRSGSFTQIFAQKLDPSGVPQWTPNGVLITNQGIDSTEPGPAIVGDEAGGCIVLWQDKRAGAVGPWDLYAQRIASNGVAAWTANGVVVCNAAGSQNSSRIISDAAGGAIALWTDSRSGDYDLYSQRIDPTGTSLWTANGLAIAVAAGDQGQAVILPDGAGGAFFAWEDCRSCGSAGVNIYAQRVNSAGAALWTANGTVVCGAQGQQLTPSIVPDGAGGIVTGWNGGTPFAQRLDAAGVAQWAADGVEVLLYSGGTPVMVSDGSGGAFIAVNGSLLGRVLPNGEPAWPPNFRATITSAADVAADEGGWVTVGFNRPLSDGTAGVTPATAGYTLWRKRPGSEASAPAGRAKEEFGKGPAPGAESAATARFSDFPPGTWDFVSYRPATGDATYSFLAPTHTDSTAAGIASEDFVVVANSMNVVSAKATGHSVDNLAPGPPQNVAGVSGAATVQVSWSPNPESDLWHYTVYRGSSPSFVPSAANRIGQPTLASFQDDAYEPGVSHYKISAIDRHGNESGFSLLTPSQITSVPPGTVPARTYLAAPAPNPARGETAIEYGLARESWVSLAIYDLNGRRVAQLVEESKGPGVWRAVWSGLDQVHRHVSAGVYLVRLNADHVTERDKIVMAE